MPSKVRRQPFSEPQAQLRLIIEWCHFLFIIPWIFNKTLFKHSCCHILVLGNVHPEQGHLFLICIRVQYGLAMALTVLQRIKGGDICLWLEQTLKGTRPCLRSMMIPERAPRGKGSWCRRSWSSKAELHNYYVLSVWHMWLNVELLNPWGSWPRLGAARASILVTSGQEQPHPFRWCACNMMRFAACRDANKFGEHCYKVSLVRGPGFHILKEMSNLPYTWLSGSQNTAD